MRCWLSGLSFPLNQELLSVLPALRDASALSPKTWPFDLSLLPQSAYLVGGSVRDALLGRQADYLDLDFVLSDRAVETARTIARHHNAGFVVLDAKHQIARVVFHQATVDFAQQVGASLETDLQRRDFTVNAIAYHPHTEQLIDPLQGQQDLQGKTLRMIAPENLQEDPLRLLRAYRQAAQLGFTLDGSTRQTIQHLAPCLAMMAAERVRGELDCLLSKPEGTPLLALAWQDGLLKPWLPDITHQGLHAIAATDQAFARLGELQPEYADLLQSWLREQTVPGLHRSWLKAAKLTQLLDPDYDKAEANLTHLKYSRAEQQAALAILGGTHYISEIADQGNSLSWQYDFFKAVGQSFLGVSVLALAAGVDYGAIAPLIIRFLNPDDPVAHPHPLISGRDLMQQLHLKPGPHIGRLLEALQRVQAEGLITTPTEALSWAVAQLQRETNPDL